MGGSALDGGGRMLDKYLYGADAIVLVYDVSNSLSFEHLEVWLATCRDVLAAAGGGSQHGAAAAVKTPMYALVANKIDLEHLRTVKSDRHHKFAQVGTRLTHLVARF